MTYENPNNWELLKPKFEYNAEEYGQLADLAYILASRGIGPEDVDLLLEPSLFDFPSHKLMYGADEAAKQIISAIKSSKKILIHGDFDADGICATSLLWRFLYHDLAVALGTKVDVVPYIPARKDEGYGLSENSIAAMKELGAELVITVDCGIRDKEIIDEHIDDLDFIVTDHHQPPEDILDVADYTIVHQAVLNSRFPHKEISGTAVAAYLTLALAHNAGLESYSLDQYIELVAISTITDIMPLDKMNRAIVSLGLQKMRDSKIPGITQLINVAGIDKDENLQSYHIGFQIGPRLNAAGRIGNAIEGVKLLSTDKPDVAKKYAYNLHQLNIKRQSLTKDYMKEAFEQIDSEEDGAMMNFIIGDSWPEGIIGLVAGKIHEATGRPTIVATQDGDIAKGSARSIEKFNITDAISLFAPHLTSYGGHAQAAGFTVKPGELMSFRNGLIAYANTKLTYDDLKNDLKIDMQIEGDNFTLDFVRAVDRLAPFGNLNQRPQFMIKDAVITELKAMGRDNNHLKLTLKTQHVGVVEAVMFNCEEDIRKLTVDAMIDVAGSLSINSWRSVENVQFQIKAWRYSQK